MGFGDSGRGQHSWTLDEEHSRDVVNQVAELAKRHTVTMTKISLAWLLTKVTVPVVGATKLHHVEGAASAVNLTLSDDEISYLEACCVPHKPVGVTAANVPVAAKG